MSVGKTIFCMLLGIGGYWLFRLVFNVPFEIMVAAVAGMAFALLIGCVIGYPVGYFVSRDGDVDGSVYRAFAWANLIAWIVPVLGTTLSAITTMMSRRSDSRGTSYFVLSTVGGLLAMLHAGWGGAAAFKERQGANQAAEMSAPETSTIPSPDRCAYAAIEAWSRADYDRYCR